MKGLDQESITWLPEGCTGIEGVRVGHAADPEALTGCTVIVCPDRGPYGVHASGGAISTRQVSALVRGHAVRWCDAVLVCGGSAYGLDAAGGVLRWLEERGRGTPVGTMRVPSVPSAALFDLFVGDSQVRPDARMGRAACECATADRVPEGRVGAGIGATVGKALGMDRACWGGVGLASLRLPSGAVVAAVAVVNAFGNVHDPETGRCIAGARREDGTFEDAESAILRGLLFDRIHAMQNTTIGVVVSDAALSADGCGRAAVIGAQAIPRCIRPAETLLDGDIVFVVSCGDRLPSEPQMVGIAGRIALERAIVRAVTAGDRAGEQFPRQIQGQTPLLEQEAAGRGSTFRRRKTDAAR